LSSGISKSKGLGRVAMAAGEGYSAPRRISTLIATQDPD
jgi:hypothetical protein